MQSLNRMFEKYGWGPADYHKVPGEKTYYVKRLPELGKAMGLNWSPMAAEVEWRGWVLRAI